MDKWQLNGCDAVGVAHLVTETPVTIAEACNRFKVCRRTVENWFSAGLESYKLGGRVYTTVQALQRFASVAMPAKPLPRQRRGKSEAQHEFEKWLGV